MRAKTEIKTASTATITEDGKLYVNDKEIKGASLYSKKWECTFKFDNGDKIILSGDEFSADRFTLEDHSVSMIMDMVVRGV